MNVRLLEKEGKRIIKDYTFQIFGANNAFSFEDDVLPKNENLKYKLKLPGRSIHGIFLNDELVSLSPIRYEREFRGKELKLFKDKIKKRKDFFKKYPRKLIHPNYDLKFELDNVDSKKYPNDLISICSSNKEGFLKIKKDDDLEKKLCSIDFIDETFNTKFHVELIAIEKKVKRIPYKLNKMGMRMFESIMDYENIYDLEGQLVEVFMKNGNVLGLLPLTREESEQRISDLENNF
jgi:hypothetical protein